MAQTDNPNKTHILHFFYDEEDSCALTLLMNDVRFHIIVDSKDLQKSSEKPLYYEYLDKISALREAEEREEARTEEGQAKKVSNGKPTRSNDKDSAVDMTADDEEDGEDGEDEDQDSGSAGVELRNWILSAFADVTAESAPADREAEEEEATLHDWYHGPTYFYNVVIKGGKLTPELLETTTDLTARIDDLVPHMHLPKYIQNLDIPWLSPHDLIVHSEVSVPEPAHPGKVVHKESGEIYFFKPVDATQPGPLKREIQILSKLEKLDLDIKVPTLKGFVSFNKNNSKINSNSKTETMGLLLSHIANPRPLTTLLHPRISRSKRAEWSKKSAAYVATLHDAGIVWGDAKADNFLVDEEDELWIIDFGGSYTEGWVDPELSETREGDEQGLEKIVRALEDPVGCTVDPWEGDDGGRGGVRETASSLFVTERKVDNDEKEETGKRKRGDEEEEGEEGTESKRAKEGE